MNRIIIVERRRSPAAGTLRWPSGALAGSASDPITLGALPMISQLPQAA